MRSSITTFLVLSLVLSLPFVSGCPEDPGVCPEALDLEPGVVDATIDGEVWQANDGFASWGGPSLQVTTGMFEGWRISLVAQRDADDTTLEDLVDAGSFPIEVTLQSGLDGGWVILYPDSGDSFATENAAGGTLTIRSVEGDEVLGCFECQVSDTYTTVEIGGGVIRVPLQ